MSENAIATDKYKRALEEIRKVVSGNYESMDPQAKKDIEKIVNEALGSESK